MSKPVKPEAGRSKHLFGVVATELFRKVAGKGGKAGRHFLGPAVDSEYGENRHPSEHCSEVARGAAHIPEATAAKWSEELGGRHRRSLTLAIAVCRVPREEAADHRQGNPRPRRLPKGFLPPLLISFQCHVPARWGVACLNAGGARGNGGS